MKKYFLHIAILLLSVQISAQTYQDYKDLGDNALYNGEYYTATYYYEQALSIDSTELNLVEKNAQAHFYYHNYLAAKKWFTYYISKQKDISSSSIVYFNLGESLQRLGQYQDAIDAYKLCIENTEDVVLIEKSTRRIESSLFAIQHLVDSCSATIGQLNDKINTAYSEFNPIPLSDSVLLFSSLRPTGDFNPNSIIESASFSRIYISSMGGSGWGTAKSFSEEINNKDAHIANACFNKKHDKIFFTICNTDDLECEIFFSELKNKKWSKPKALEKNVNFNGYTSTQPHFFEGEEYDILYFVSNKPGGYGNFDIWYSIYKEGVFHQAVNVGSNINTKGNEITPFYSPLQKALFFSSDWHDGFGAYDIFKSYGQLNEWSEVHNLLLPINSSCNDFNYAIIENDTNAYLASNRPESHYLKGESCCYDIFSVEYFHKAIVYTETPDTIVEDSITKSIKDLLPLTLYFHNDEPNPKTQQTTTTKNYKTTLEEYFALKDTYKKEYSKGYTNLEKLKAEKDIEDFFSYYIGKGFYDLELFSSYLIQDLTRGNSVKLTVKGYCSPLNSTSYNVNLAKRRIHSLIVFLEEYDNGIFIPYLNGNAENGAKLIIYKDPIGESLSNPFVSDNANDSRNSIYSRSAAFERKIQIIMYESGNEESSIYFAKLNYDLGNLKKNESLELEIPIKNNGGSDLQISSVELQNATTTYELSKKVISNGENAYLILKIQSGEKEGYHQETISIFSNDSAIKTNLVISYYVED
jgi:Protein of unknown function (DUF1573)/Tetratricopeptide repeat